MPGLNISSVYLLRGIFHRHHRTGPGKRGSTRRASNTDESQKADSSLDQGAENGIAAKAKDGGEGNNEGEGETLEVGFSRDDGEDLGLVLEDDFEGIYIAEITPGGAVNRDGRLKEGDRVLVLASTTLDDVAHDEATQLLNSMQTDISITVFRAPAAIANGGDADSVNIPKVREILHPHGPSSRVRVCMQWHKHIPPTHLHTHISGAPCAAGK